MNDNKPQLIAKINSDNIRVAIIEGLTNKPKPDDISSIDFIRMMRQLGTHDSQKTLYFVDNLVNRIMAQIRSEVKNLEVVKGGKGNVIH